MRLFSLFGLCVLLMAQNVATVSAGPENSNEPQYTADGRLVFPANYREWIYLSTGMDMDYNPDPMTMDHSMFDNVFVNPAAYKAFVATGTWPDKTILVLESRMATGKGSINKKGHYQTNAVMARSIHIKDESHFPGKWAFVGFGDGNTGKVISKEAECYSCHEKHGAVDTTFVQFYPTLLEIAQKKGTLSKAYLKEGSGNRGEGAKGSK